MLSTREFLENDNDDEVSGNEPVRKKPKLSKHDEKRYRTLCRELKHFYKMLRLVYPEFADDLPNSGLRGEVHPSSRVREYTLQDDFVAEFEVLVAENRSLKCQHTRHFQEQILPEVNRFSEDAPADDSESDEP